MNMNNDEFAVEKFIDFCDNMMLAEESSKNNNHGKYGHIKNCLKIIYGHMLKYQFHQKDQSSNWISSIIENTNQIITIKPSRFNSYITDFNIMNRSYAKAILLVACKDNDYKVTDFPKERPEDWTFFNVTNKSFVLEFLTKNAKIVI